MGAQGNQRRLEGSNGNTKYIVCNKYYSFQSLFFSFHFISLKTKHDLTNELSVNDAVAYMPYGFSSDEMRWDGPDGVQSDDKEVHIMLNGT